MDPGTSNASESAVRNFTNPEWTTAKRGLVAYRRALIISIIVGICGGVVVAIMTVGTVMSRGSGGLGTILWLGLILAVVSLALSLWMLIGLYNFSKVPAETGARGPASVALVISGIGLLVSVYATIGVARLALGGPVSLFDLASQAEDSTWTNLARLGQLVGFICLIVALRKVAVHVGAAHVVQRIGSFIVLTGVIIGLVVLLMLVPHPVLVLLAGLAVLVLVIIALVKFLGILEALGAAIGGLDVSKVFE